MIIDSYLYTLLTTDPAIAAIVGEKVYPFVAPTGTKAPYLVYSLPGISQSFTHSGHDGLNDYTAQISGYASTYAIVRNLKLAIEDALYGNFEVKNVDPCVYEINSVINHESDTKLFTCIVRFSAYGT